MNHLSASVTRILFLSGFPRELKTRDIQAAFSQWEHDQGGFRIKWLDDTSLLVVFQDASVAKRAYLTCLMSPPPQFVNPPGEAQTVVRPYDGPDAQAVIAIVNQRSQHNAHRSRSSISGPVGHNRNASRGGAALPTSNNPAQAPLQENGAPQMPVPHPNGSQTSPTALATMPEHPTLDTTELDETLQNQTKSGSTTPSPALVSSDSTDSVTIVLGNGSQPTSTNTSPPRIGNPGKRMLGAALGIRHPALGSRVITPQVNNDVDKLAHSMNGLAVAE
jgi:hypothetical protein